MDYLLHDVYLPGFAPSNNAKTKSSSGQHSSKQNNDIVRIPNSLLRLLRDSGPNRNETLRLRSRPDSGESFGSDDELQKQVLRIKLAQASCYTDWLAAASELDSLEAHDEWKSEEECDEYDVRLVRAHMQQLEDARISCDAGRMLFLVRTTLTRNLGGMGDLSLYKHCRIGTKSLIEGYIEAALDTLEALVDLSSPTKHSGLDTREVYEQLLRSRQAFGRSALLLSGGGTLGMNHIGVVKGLYEAQLLPRIVSGASAGSIVAAVLCTRTDDEIPQFLRDFCEGDLDVFERDGEEEGVLQKAFRFLTKGALFDISNLVRVMRDLLGDMTFQEAYNRTRRILNIPVSTASLYELPRLLNYVTAPNVMIWSAVATSCSVPFVFSPAQLLAKDPRTGKEVPWDQSPQRWIDGSVDNDLPMTRLAEMFNVNHFIVSQVNPHVVPFLDKDEDSVASQFKASSATFAAGPSWLRTMAELAKDEALHRMHVLAELGVMPTTMSKMRSVLSQRYSGDITILPEVSYTQFPNVLRNPTSEFMVQAMLSGQRATWPKLSQVRNHCAIELALDDAVQRIRTRLVFSPSQVDLRLSAFAGSDGSHLAGRGKRRQNRRASHESPPLDGNLLAVAPRLQPYGASYDRQSGKVLGSDVDSASSDLETVPSSNIEDFDNSEDLFSSSGWDSPPSPRPEATSWLSARPPFSSVSQPSTPSIASRAFSPFVQSGHAVSATANQNPLKMTLMKELSTPERKYKQMFHKTSTAEDTSNFRAPTADIAIPLVMTPEDLSDGGGTKRRKRSLSTGLKGLWPPRRH